MARIRFIKPGLFLNDTLAELPIAARFLFSGLWTIADRDGRLEDRPRRIKAELLPFDDEDVDSLLQGLHDRGFILRYESGGEAYISIIKWHQHQKPHPREVESTIPAPPITGHSTDISRSDPVITRLSDVKALPEPDLGTAKALLSNADPNSNSNSNSNSDPPSGGSDFAETQNTPPILEPLKLQKQKATKAKKPPDPRVNEVFKAIEAAYGDSVPHPPRQCAEIVTMLRNRDPADIVSCWSWKSQQRGGAWVDLVYVTKDIADWKAGRLNGQKGQSNAGPKKYPGPRAEQDPEEYYRGTIALTKRT